LEQDMWSKAVNQVMQMHTLNMVHFACLPISSNPPARKIVETVAMGSLAVAYIDNFKHGRRHSSIMLTLPWGFFQIQLNPGQRNSGVHMAKVIRNQPVDQVAGLIYINNTPPEINTAAGMSTTWVAGLAAIFHFFIFSLALPPSFPPSIPFTALVGS
jgi:hypothetical protein